MIKLKNRKDQVKMGWTSEYVSHKMNYSELRDFITSKWSDNNNINLNKTALRGNIAFTIVRRFEKVDGNYKDCSFIAVTLIKQLKSKSGYGYEIIYKEMTEHMLPAHQDCPVSYIKELGGVNGIDDEIAREWRRNVINYARKSNNLKIVKELGAPVTVRFNGEDMLISYNPNQKKWYVTPETVIGI